MAFGITTWTNNTPSTNLSIVTSLAAHNVAVAVAVTDFNGGTFTWPSGFTELKTQACTADSQLIGIAVKKDCTGSEGTLQITNSSSALVGAILGISGGDNTTQPDVTTPTPGNNNVAAASPWSLTCAITPTTNGSLLVALTGDDITATSATSVTHAYSDTGSLGWTEQSNLNDGGFIKGGVGTATQATAGATTVTVQGTLASKSAGRSLILIAIRSASGGADVLMPQALL